jgi:hypothetical protein
MGKPFFHSTGISWCCDWVVQAFFADALTHEVGLNGL